MINSFKVKECNEDYTSKKTGERFCVLIVHKLSVFLVFKLHLDNAKYPGYILYKIDHIWRIKK